jgi:hypothetical protein
MQGVLNPLDESQLRSQEARRIFEASEAVVPWMEDYWQLLAEGWTWRQAVFMLWEALPKNERRPRTQGELAVQVLGLTSDRQIRKWKDNPAMDVRVAKLAAAALARARPEIYAALIRAATNPDPRAHSDRKLALEMLGDYVPKQKLRIGPDLENELTELSDEELLALKGGAGG